MNDEIILLFLLHTSGWFVLGALESFARGRSRVITIWTALSLGVMSGVFHLLLRHFHYVS